MATIDAENPAAGCAVWLFRGHHGRPAMASAREGDGPVFGPRHLLRLACMPFLRPPGELDHSAGPRPVIHASGSAVGTPGRGGAFHPAAEMRDRVNREARRAIRAPQGRDRRRRDFRHVGRLAAQPANTTSPSTRPRPAWAGTATPSRRPARGPIPVDMGFIVYNEANYPNLVALFEHLGVPTKASDMGFAVSLDEGRLEYGGDNLSTLFAQWRNLVRPRFWSMLSDLVRFYREAPRPTPAPWTPG